MSDESEVHPIEVPIGTDGEPMVDPDEAALPAGLAEPGAPQMPTESTSVSRAVAAAQIGAKVRASKKPKVDENVLLARSLLSAGIKASAAALLDSMEPSNMVKRLAQLEALAEQAQGPLSVLGKDQVYLEDPKPEVPQVDPFEENLGRWGKVPRKIQNRIRRLIERSGLDANDVMYGPTRKARSHPPDNGLSNHTARVQQALQAAAAEAGVNYGAYGPASPYSGSPSHGLFSQGSISEVDIEDAIALDEDEEEVGISGLYDTAPGSGFPVRSKMRRETAGVRAMEDIVAAIGSIAGNRNLAADLQAYNEAKKAGFDDLAESIKQRIYASEGATLDVQRTADALVAVSSRGTPDAQEGIDTHLISGGTPDPEDVEDPLQNTIDNVLDDIATDDSNVTVGVIDESGGL